MVPVTVFSYDVLACVSVPCFEEVGAFSVLQKLKRHYYKHYAAASLAFVD